MRPVFDVSAYGAAGDGVTNDHDAIVRALYREYLPTQFGLHRVPRFDPDEGAVLRFGPGRYRIDGTLARVVAQHRLVVEGAGPGRTVLAFDQHDGRPLPGAPFHRDPRSRLAAGGHPGHWVDELTIAHLTLTTDPFPFEGSDRTLGLTALSVGWCRRLRITDVEVAGVPSFGIYAHHCRDVLIEGCHVHHTHVDGVHVSRSRGVRIEGCRVHDTGDDAIAVSGTEDHASSNVVVTGNEVERAGSRGIAVFGVRSALVTANRIRGTYQAGITVCVHPGHAPSRDVAITDNDVRDAGLHPGERPPEAPLWGGGAPSGIAVVDDHEPHVGVMLRRVRIEGNRLGRCRNSFVSIRRARDVSVGENRFDGPLVTGPRPWDGGEGGVGLSGSGVVAPAGPPGAVPVRVVESTDVTVAARTGGHAPPA
ncbi:MAG: right-handed parallel beta-helix repeat-containing protein [Acidimicrobiales bacterium]|nr:right-handed parallel beta-helix repeat-containing protein [Acidimicrobiales bacterium]